MRIKPPVDVDGTHKLIDSYSIIDPEPTFYEAYLSLMVIKPMV